MHTFNGDASYNLKVSVFEECVFDRGQASHTINLLDMAMKYADVIPLKEAIDYIRALPANLFAPALREDVSRFTASPATVSDAKPRGHKQ